MTTAATEVGVAEGVVELIRTVTDWQTRAHRRAKSGPAQSILVTTWSAEDDAHTGNALIGVQVRVRGDTTDEPRTVIHISENIRDAITALRGVAFSNGITVTAAWRERGTGLGDDPSAQYERADTYTLRTDRASTA